MPETKSFCPYVGLQPYTEDLSEYFFGRKRDQRVIRSNMFATSLTVLYGASGVGKSSILMAGVVPGLRRDKRTAVVIFREWQSANFVDAFKQDCINAVEKVQRKPSGLSIHLELDKLLDRAAESLGGRIFVLLDQFEEFFYYHPESQNENEFDEQLALAVNRQDARASFLISLREDALSKLDRFRGRIPNLLGNTIRLEHLSHTGAEEAVREPLRVYSQKNPESVVDIEDTLVEQVIRQVRRGQLSLGPSARVEQTITEETQVETPFLQLVMERLWAEEMDKGSRMLRLETLTQLGGAERILRTHLDTVMSSALTQTQQAIAANIFFYLVTPSGTRIAHTVPDLGTYVKLPEEEIEGVLKILSSGQVRVLRPVVASVSENETVHYEIFHDVLAQAVLDWRQRYLRAKQYREHTAEVLLVRLTKGAAIFTLEHSRAVNAAQFSPDGTCLVTATEDGTAKVWNVSAGQEIAELRNQTKWKLNNAVFSPNGKWIVTASTDGTAGVWETSTGKKLAELRGHSDWVNSAVFSPKGEYIVTASRDNTARLWDTRTWGPITDLLGHTNWVISALFSPDGKFIVTASYDGMTRVWDIESGALIMTLRGHSPLTSVAVSPDSKFIVTSSWDIVARVWEVHTGATKTELRGHTNRVNSAVFSPDGNYILTTSDNTARVWKADTGEVITILRGHKGSINCATFSPDSKYVVTGSNDNDARVWNALSGASIACLRGHVDVVTAAAFSPDWRYAVTASRDKLARIW